MTYGSIQRFAVGYCKQCRAFRAARNQQGDQVYPTRRGRGYFPCMVDLSSSFLLHDNSGSTLEGSHTGVTKRGELFLLNIMRANSTSQYASQTPCLAPFRDAVSLHGTGIDATLLKDFRTYVPVTGMSTTCLRPAYPTTLPYPALRPAKNRSISAHAFQISSLSSNL